MESLIERLKEIKYYIVDSVEILIKKVLNNK